MSRTPDFSCLRFHSHDFRFCFDPHDIFLSNKKTKHNKNKKKTCAVCAEVAKRISRKTQLENTKPGPYYSNYWSEGQKSPRHGLPSTKPLSSWSTRSMGLKSACMLWTAFIKSAAKSLIYARTVRQRDIDDNVL